MAKFKLVVRVQMVLEVEVEAPDLDSAMEEVELQLEQAIMPNVCAYPMIQRVEVASSTQRHQYLAHVEDCGGLDNSPDDFACLGCGCKPGDGITESCDHPEGCGYSKRLRGVVHGPLTFKVTK